MLVVSMEGVEEVPQTDRAVRWWSWQIPFKREAVIIFYYWKFLTSNGVMV